MYHKYLPRYTDWEIENVGDSSDIVILRKPSLENIFLDLQTIVGEQTVQLQSLTNLLLQHGVSEESISRELDQCLNDFDPTIPHVREKDRDDVESLPSFQESEDLNSILCPQEEIDVNQLEELVPQILESNLPPLKSINEIIIGTDETSASQSQAAIYIINHFDVSEIVDGILNFSSKNFQDVIKCTKVCENLIFNLRNFTTSISIVGMLEMFLVKSKSQFYGEELCWINQYLENLQNVAERLLHGDISDKNDFDVGYVQLQEELAERFQNPPLFQDKIGAFQSRLQLAYFLQQLLINLQMICIGWYERHYTNEFVNYAAAQNN